VRAGIEARAANHPTHRANRFFGFVGINCDRRIADTSALNMPSYMLEITANDAVSIAPHLQRGVAEA
jgi:hypothetical protein